MTTQQTTMLSGTKVATKAVATKAVATKAVATKAVATKAVATKATRKKRVAKKPSSNQQLAAARAFIKKKTGCKQVVEDLGPKAHIGTGCFALDDLIGGTLSLDKSGPKCPGFPRRAMSEVFGAEASGKTTGALETIAECQRKGGIAMFLDYEHALDHGYAKTIGVDFDPDRLLLYEPQTFEDGLKMMYGGLKAGVDIIVVDSVAAMMPKAALEKNLDKEATIGFLARALSYSLPKIINWLHDPVISTNPQGTALLWINQARSKIGGTGRGSNMTTPGGWALKFYCWVRLQYTRIGSEVVERKDRITGQSKKYAYGNNTIVKVIKNKVDAKQGHSTNVFIRYGQGIDEAYTLIATGVTNKLIKKEAAGWYTLLDGTRFHGREKLRLFLVDHPKEFAALRAQALAAISATAEEMEVELSEEDSIQAAMEDEFESEFGADDDHVLDESDTDGDIGDDAALNDDD